VDRRVILFAHHWYVAQQIWLLTVVRFESNSHCRHVIPNMVHLLVSAASTIGFGLLACVTHPLLAPDGFSGNQLREYFGWLLHINMTDEMLVLDLA
jgi:hypothetical protein